MKYFLEIRELQEAAFKLDNLAAENMASDAIVKWESDQPFAPFAVGNTISYISDPVEPTCCKIQHIHHTVSLRETCTILMVLPIFLQEPGK